MTEFRARDFLVSLQPETYPAALHQSGTYRTLTGGYSNLGDAGFLADAKRTSSNLMVNGVDCALLSANPGITSQEAAEAWGALWEKGLGGEKIFTTLLIAEKLRSKQADVLKAIEGATGKKVAFPEALCKKMDVLDALRRKLKEDEEHYLEHANEDNRVSFETMIQTSKASIQELETEIQGLASGIYASYDADVKKHFSIATAQYVMPQSFEGLGSAVLADSFLIRPDAEDLNKKPQKKAPVVAKADGIFFVDRKCAQNTYYFSSTEQAVSAVIQTEMYAAQYFPGQIPAKAINVEDLEGVTLKAPGGDYLLFRQGTAVWVTPAKFEKIREQNFVGYDCILSIESIQKSDSLSHSTPQQVRVTQHVDVPLDQRFLTELAFVRVQETSIDAALFSSAPPLLVNMATRMNAPESAPEPPPTSKPKPKP